MVLVYSFHYFISKILGIKEIGSILSEQQRYLSIGMDMLDRSVSVQSVQIYNGYNHMDTDGSRIDPC
jgi:hypothetical protein